MLGLVINIILAVALIGATLYGITKTRQYNSLDDEYFDLSKRQDDICKQLDLAKRENKVLQEENAKLNQAPKIEKVSKPRTKKTTKK